MTKEIMLTKNKIVVVDDADYDFLMQWKWHFSPSGTGYASRNEHIGYFEGKQKQNKIRMHTVIMNTPTGLEVDHINGDTLDNRKINLRLCTHAENLRNSTKRKNTSSKYKGVFWVTSKKKWRSVIRGKQIVLGEYETKEEAALSYNIAASKLYGKFAKLNNII